MSVKDFIRGYKSGLDYSYKWFLDYPYLNIILKLVGYYIIVDRFKKHINKDEFDKYINKK